MSVYTHIQDILHINMDKTNFERVDNCIWQQRGSPGGSDRKISARNAGDLGSVPGSGRSPGGGHDNLLQYSCLENHMDGGTWWATVYRVAELDTTK